MVTLMCCLVLLLISALFRWVAEAIPAIELNRVLLAYDSGYDLCREVTEITEHESKTAADNECEKAFQALDFLQLNACGSWRHAACRPISGDEFYQCTCLVSSCDSHSIKAGVVTPFRNCAPAVRTQEQRMGRAPPPTASFRRTRRAYDVALEKAEVRRYFDFSGFFDGDESPGGVDTSAGAAGSSTFHITGGADGARGAEGAGGAGVADGGGGASTSATADPVGSSISKYYECDQCGAKKRSARALFDHKRTCHTEGDTRCYVCNKNYKNKDALMSHFRIWHPNFAAEEVASRRIPANPFEAEELLPFPCHTCSRRYSSPHGLRDHKKSHTTDETTCPNCKRTLSTKSGLKIHLERCFPDDPLPPPKTQKEGPKIKAAKISRFKCEDCDKSYASKKGLQDHRKSHKTLDTYCLFCDLTMSTKYNYRSHMELTHPEIARAEAETARKKYEADHPEVCGQCGKRFKNPNGLRDHLAVHDGRTECDVCHAILPRTTALASHKKRKHPS